MNQERQNMPNLKDFRNALVDQLGAEEAATLIDRVVLRYYRLYQDRVDHDDRALQTHLEENILPGLALYQVLREARYGEEEALEITAEAFAAWGQRGRRRMRMLGRLPFAYQVIRLLVRRVMAASFPSEGWEIEWVEVSSRQVAFNMKSCFYLDTLRAYGAPELTRVYCDLDDAIYDGVSPCFEWKRTKTLGRGNDVCDFGFKRTE